MPRPTMARSTATLRGLEDALRFYANAFDMREVARRPLRDGRVRVELEGPLEGARRHAFEWPPPARGSRARAAPRRHGSGPGLAIETPDVHSSYAALRAEGATPVHAPRRHGGRWVARVAGPDGAALTLRTPRAGA